MYKKYDLIIIEYTGGYKNKQIIFKVDKTPLKNKIEKVLFLYFRIIVYIEITHKLLDPFQILSPLKNNNYTGAKSRTSASEYIFLYNCFVLPTEVIIA